MLPGCRHPQQTGLAQMAMIELTRTLSERHKMQVLPEIVAVTIRRKLRQ
jgi:hypothetical protein